MRNNRRKKEFNNLTLMLFLVTLFVWIAMLLLKVILWRIEWRDLFDDIISNILGIIPPILIFEFAHEYLTKDKIADEVSEQITKTLIADSEIIDVFKDEDKVKFVRNTVKHIVGDESAEMVNAVIDPYITNKYDIKNFFKYSIILRNYSGESNLFNDSNYIKVYENLKYKKVFINSEKLSKEIRVAFILNNQKLDSALRNQEYLFQENLSIGVQELNTLKEYSKTDKEKFIKDELQFTLFIDEFKCDIADVTISNEGIFITLNSEHNMEQYEHSVEISFSMPQDISQNEILVSISEPTFSPMIQLSYPESSMSVKAYSFLNNATETSIEKATHNIGSYEFCIQDKWVYPMSGVVFLIETST